MKTDDLKALTKQTAVDHIVNTIKATLSAFPYAGGVVASLISDYIPKSREKKTIDFIGKVAEDLEFFKDRVNKDYLKSDEFQYLFQKAWRVAIEHYQAEKIDGFRAILINSAIGKEATGDDRDLYINILNDLTGYHFQLLKVFQNPIEWNKQHGNRVVGASMIISLNQILRQCFPEWNEERIALIIDDLYYKKLSSIPSDRLKVGQTGGGIEKLTHALTPFGQRFIDYVTIEPKRDHS